MSILELSALEDLELLMGGEIDGSGTALLIEYERLAVQGPGALCLLHILVEIVLHQVMSQRQ